ncbi:MAG: class I SAM-dependent methyltransferase [Caldiserica bacterium]|nr:class I SAM-dependent methyltransferase [Caldisericota bacterium]
MNGELGRFYEIFPWYDDPESERGRRYFEATVGAMEKLAQHPWIRGEGALRVLEICGGAGFGGVALAKVLGQRGVAVDLTITDLRAEALERARAWGTETLGRKVRTRIADAPREVHKLGEKYDLVLMYGLSTPHFDPWELVRLLASVGEALEDDGIFAVEESDRRYRIFLMIGYKWALAEAAEEKFTVSFHTGYDLHRGTIRRHYLDLGASGAPVEMETYMWGLAEVGAFVWTFFEEVDFLQLRNERHFILGRKPRRNLSPSHLRPPGFLGGTEA